MNLVNSYRIILTIYLAVCKHIFKDTKSLHIENLAAMNSKKCNMLKSKNELPVSRNKILCIKSERFQTISYLNFFIQSKHKKVIETNILIYRVIAIAEN